LKARNSPSGSGSVAESRPWRKGRPGEDAEHGVEGGLHVRRPLRVEGPPALPGQALGPARIGARFGARHAQLRDAVDQAEREAGDLPLHLQGGALVAQLHEQQPGGDGAEQQDHGGGEAGEARAVDEEEDEADEGEEAGEHQVEHVAGEQTADRVDPHRPIRQVAHRVAAEEGDRQGEQAVPDSGLQDAVRLAAEAQHGEAARDLEQRRGAGADHQGEGDLQQLAARGRGDRAAEELPGEDRHEGARGAFRDRQRSRRRPAKPGASSRGRAGRAG
jgi:hypothetical protein